MRVFLFAERPTACALVNPNGNPKRPSGARDVVQGFAGQSRQALGMNELLVTPHGFFLGVGGVPHEKDIVQTKIRRFGLPLQRVAAPHQAGSSILALRAAAR